MASNLLPLHHFEQLDQIIYQHQIIARSLNPQKNQCTSFQQLGDLVVTVCTDGKTIDLIQNSLELILIAQIQNFPENIFWDFDYIVREILQIALNNQYSIEQHLEEFTSKMVSLMDLFGNNHEICFRYVHDFSYGFDWARWVQKQPQQRSQTHPFNDTFLNDLLQRGHAMIQAIASDSNDQYRACQNSYRNSFNFSREPEDEYRLMTILASYQLIPVPTWDWNATPTWDKPFDQLREQVSRKLEGRE